MWDSGGGGGGNGKCGRRFHVFGSDEKQQYCCAADASAGADTCGNGNNGATAEFRADFDIDADATIDVNVPTSMLMRPSESWADSDASWADIAPDAGADSGDTCRCAAVAESKSMSAYVFDRCNRVFVPRT